MHRLGLGRSNRYSVFLLGSLLVQNTILGVLPYPFSDALAGNALAQNRPDRYVVNGELRRVWPHSTASNSTVSRSTTITNPLFERTLQARTSPAGLSLETYYKNFLAGKSFNKHLERANFDLNSHSEIFLSNLPKFQTSYLGSFAAENDEGEVAVFTINPELQHQAQLLVDHTNAPHVAIVAMEPDTGRILAIAQKSKNMSDLAMHAGFPAASIFKLVTSAAALEQSSLRPESIIKFRGGDYTLNWSNYNPNSKRDTRSMSLAEGLARSANPVFARVALQYLNRDKLAKYAKAFGFNTDLNFDITARESAAKIPSTGAYQLARTAAGFGDVKLSPLHAALMASAIARRGSMPRPTIVDRVVDRTGNIIYRAHTQTLGTAMRPETADKLLNMMEYTTTIGTSKSAFYPGGRAALPGVSVSAKTGTLRGSSPQGLNKWFVATAPRSNPKIALAIIVVNPKTASDKSCNLGARLLKSALKIL